MWDAQEKKCVGVLMGHTGSVKAICSHPTNQGTIMIHTHFEIEFSPEERIIEISNLHILMMSSNRYACIWFKGWVLFVMGPKVL